MAPPPDLRSCKRVLLLITALAYADNELAIWALQVGTIMLYHISTSSLPTPLPSTTSLTLHTMRWA